MQYSRPAANPISTRLHPSTFANGDLFKATREESYSMGSEVEDEKETTPARPFFDIDLGDAPSTSQEPTPLSSNSPPPSSIHIGSLGAAVEAPHSPQLTGTVATMDGAFTFQQPDEATKKSFRWGQFFVGLFMPWAVIFLFSLVVETMQPDWEDMPDFSRAEDVLLTPGEDGWYTHTINKTAEESFRLDFTIDIDSETSANINVYYDPRDVDWEDNGKVRQTNYTNYQYDETTVIGEYTPGNQTVWFQLDNASADEHFAFLYISDYLAMEAWENENGVGAADAIGSTLFCGLGPIAYITGLIAAFSRGNRALGYGLLCAIPLAVIMGPALIILLVIMFGF